MIDLNKPGELSKVAKKIADDIDNYAVKTYDDGFRTHLGASQIGEDCQRKLWYVFRWCGRESFSGRMLRLFQRGHREEERFAEYLNGIGAEFHPFDPEKINEPDKGKRQFRLSRFGGHFGGSLDGIAKLPESYQIPDRILTEFKTNGTGKGFSDLKTKGVALAKPMHFAQMCVYGFAFGLKHTLYMNVNKNDDDLYVELLKLDEKLGASMIERAYKIIAADCPPEKIAETPAALSCLYCNFKKLCFENERPVKNCRSCSACKPVWTETESAWLCENYNAVIPSKSDILNACGSWKPIING